MEPTDDSLMLRAARGDLDAFGLLVDRHHARALNVAHRLTGDVEWAKDAVQESFLNILEAAERYQARGSFTSYLFTVLRNVVRQAARSRARRREESLEALADPEQARIAATVPRPPTPAEVLEAQRRQESLQAALLALSFEVRTVFVLSEIEGLSYREIARICGCPMGTVASRKHQAVVELRKRLLGMVEP